MCDNLSSNDEKRLWVGNLDPRVTEFQLLKILQKYGEIDKFDMLFHRSGLLSGQPRGYAFVTYKSIFDSKKALEKLNGLQIGNKYISVRLAKNIDYDELDRPKPKIEIPVLAAGKSNDKKFSKEITIQAIEAKLKILENKTIIDDFEINKSVYGETPLIQKYQYNKNQESTNKIQTKRTFTKTRSRPYNRNRKR